MSRKSAKRFSDKDMLGENYFVNIIFDGATLSGENTGFTAQFSIPSPVPGLGLASLAALALARFYARARRA